MQQITFEIRLDACLHPAAIITPEELSDMKYSKPLSMGKICGRIVFYYLVSMQEIRGNKRVVDCYGSLFHGIICQRAVHSLDFVITFLFFDPKIVLCKEHFGKNDFSIFTGIICDLV